MVNIIATISSKDIPRRRTVITSAGEIPKTRRTTKNGRIVIRGKERETILVEAEKLARKKAEEERKKALEARSAEEKAAAFEKAVKEKTARAEQFRELQEQRRIAAREKELQEAGFRKVIETRRPSFAEREVTVKYLPPEREKGVLRETPKEERPKTGAARVVGQFREGFSLQRQERDVRTLGGAEATAYTLGVVGSIATVSPYAWRGAGAKTINILGKGKTAGRIVYKAGEFASKPPVRVLGKGLEYSYYGGTGFELGSAAKREGAVGVARKGVGIGRELVLFGAASKVLGRSKQFRKGFEAGVEKQLLTPKRESTIFALGKKGRARLTPQRKIMRGEKFIISQTGRIGAGLSGRSRGSSLKVRTRQVGVRFAKTGKEKRFLQNVPRTYQPKQDKQVIPVTSKQILEGKRLIDQPKFALESGASDSLIVQSYKNFLRSEKAKRGAVQQSVEMAVKKTQRYYRKRGIEISRKEILRLIKKDVRASIVTVEPKFSYVGKPTTRAIVPRVDTAKPVKLVVKRDKPVSPTSLVTRPSKPLRERTLRPATVAELGEKTKGVRGVYSGVSRVGFGESIVGKQVKVIDTTARVVEPTPKIVGAEVGRLDAPVIVTGRVSGVRPRPVVVPDKDVRLEKEIDFKAGLKPDVAISSVKAIKPSVKDKIDYKRDLVPDYVSRLDSKVKVTPVAVQPAVTKPKTPFSKLQKVVKPTKPVKTERIKYEPNKPTKPLRPKVPLRKTPKFEPPKRKRERVGYRVLVRRRGKFVREAGVFDIKSAKRLGALRVGTTAAATFKLEKTTGRVKKFAGGVFKKSQFYKKPSGEYIEKREKRIKSLGELQEITYKGLAVQKNRRRWT